MGAPPSGRSGRDLLAYFAGHLANLLNGNDQPGDDSAVVEVKAYRLYEKVHRLLLTNRAYHEVLVGAWSYQLAGDPEECVDFYIEAVLDRPISRRGGNPSSSDHLRGLIAARAAEPFEADGAGELSTWQALVGGPTRLRRLAAREELFELSNRILKCLDAANRPYAEVLRLGLCPKDWLRGDAEVPVNTLKAANAFLKVLKAAMGGEVGRRPRPAELAAAWAKAPVPGHGDPASFAVSLLGSAILSRLSGQDRMTMVAFDDADGSLGPAELAEDEALLSAEEAAPILAGAVRDGVIAADEQALLTAIMAGLPLAEAMKSDLGLRRRLKSRHEGDLDAYVTELSGRVARYVSGVIDPRP